jgi:hypothetical protein
VARFGYQALRMPTWLEKLSGKHVVPSTTNIRTSASLVVLAILGVGAAAIILKRREALDSNVNMDDDEHVEMMLAPVDIMVHTVGIPPVSSITWLSGNYQKAIPFIRDRMNAVLQKNPWLAGRIVKGKSGRLVLRHPTAVSSEKGEDFLVVITEAEAPLTQSMLLPELTRHSSSLTLRKNGPKEDLWRVCIVPCRSNPKENFAIIMSISHTLGGASTYYGILSMLTRAEEKVKSMQIERVPDYHDLQVRLFGKEETEYPSSRKMIHSVIRGALQVWITGAKIQQKVFLIDNEKIKALKKKSKTDKVPFVSTNDILVSWFAQHCKGDYTFVNVDAKGKLPSITTDMAGNYQIAIIYGKEDTASPSLIRQSLMPSQNGGMIRRVVTAGSLPSYWQGAFQFHFGMTSNWASFSQPVSLPRDTGCKELLHSPLVDMSDFLPSTFTEMIIFRPSLGRTAIRITGHDLRWLQDSPPPFASGEKI